MLNDKNDLVAKSNRNTARQAPRRQSAVDAFAKGRQLVMRICQVVTPRQLLGAIDGLEMNACPALICAFLCSPRLDWWSP